MTYVDPALNGVGVLIYKLNKDASPHPFRNRVMLRGLCYESLSTSPIEMQVHFFSKDALRWRNDVGQSRSLGYVWGLTEVFNYLGITPVEDEWIRYRIQFPDLGDNYYCISGVAPKCHLDGEWLYYRVDFEEDNSSDSMGLDENDAEPIDNMTEVLVEVPNE